MNSLYESKVRKMNEVMPRVWCPCEGSCTAGCTGTCRWTMGAG